MANPSPPSPFGDRSDKTVDEEGKPDERPTIPTQLSPSYASSPPKILDPVLAWGSGLAANPLGWVELSDEDQGQERRGAGASRAGAGEEDCKGDGGERGKGEG